jgi:hypothetical protein
MADDSAEKMIAPQKKDLTIKTITVTMEPKNSIKLFETRQVRSVWDSEQEKWYISIVDVILSKNPDKA